MAKPEWGIKRVCQNCQTKYYDLCKRPSTCPNCKTEFDPEAVLRSRRQRPQPAEPEKDDDGPKDVVTDAGDTDEQDREEAAIDDGGAEIVTGRASDDDDEAASATTSPDRLIDNTIDDDDDDAPIDDEAGKI